MKTTAITFAIILFMPPSDILVFGTTIRGTGQQD